MLFLIPFMLVGLGLIAAIPIRLLVLSHGTPVAVTIDGKKINTNSKKNSRTYFVQFHYVLNGATHYDRQQVSLGEYNQAVKGNQTSGRAMQIGPSTLCISNVGNPNDTTGTFAVTAVIWNAFMALFYYFTWGVALRQKKLVREGTPAAGTLLARDVIKGKAISYTVTFKFKTSDGSEITNKVGVALKSYESAVVGDTVTVLYDPAKPARSVVYEYCNFEVVPGNIMYPR